MSDVVRPCCWICVPKCSPPETPRFEVGFGELCFIHLGVKCKDGSNILGQVWLSWALLRYLEATAMLLGSKLGDLEGKLGSGGRPTWGILFGHFVAFAARNAFPQQDQDFKWVSASYAGSIWGQSTAILWPRWCHRGANFGDFGANFAILGLCWRLYGIILDHATSTYSKKTIYASKTLSPVALEAACINAKNQSKTKISSKTLTYMAVQAKPDQKSIQNLPSKRSRQWPCNPNLWRDIQGPPSRANEMTMFLAKFLRVISWREAPLARPAPTERCGRIHCVVTPFYAPTEVRLHVVQLALLLVLHAPLYSIRYGCIWLHFVRPKKHTETSLSTITPNH